MPPRRARTVRRKHPKAVQKAPQRVPAAKTPKAGPKSATTATTSATTTSPTTTAGSTTAAGTLTATAVDFTSAPVGQKISTNTALRSKLEARLQALGYQGTVYEAAYGFKNLGQFVAATNVSQNLGLSFTDLKTRMTGLSVDAEGTILKANLNPDGTIAMVDPAVATNPAPTNSVGQSIQTVKSTADATAAAETATTQAEMEIKTTSAGSSTTSSTSTKPQTRKNGKT